MFRKTLSETLNSEIESHSPYNGSLLRYKRWSDNLRPPLNKYAHKFLHKFMEWWYEKPIYLHQKPMDEQVRIVRELYGSDVGKIPPKSKDYTWEGDGDWHR